MGLDSELDWDLDWLASLDSEGVKKLARLSVFVVSNGDVVVGGMDVGERAATRKSQVDVFRCAPHILCSDNGLDWPIPIVNQKKRVLTSRPSHSYRARD